MCKVLPSRLPAVVGKRPGSPGEQLLRIIQLREEVDLVAEAMMSPHRVFTVVSLTIPRIEPAELGMIRTVAYLYVLYYEAGDIAVPYLLGLWDAFGLDSDREIRSHRQSVGRLRTLFQHNLSPSSSTDRVTREFCQLWFSKNCNTPVPGDEIHWLGCLNGILGEAHEFLRTMKDCLRAIETDEGREGILDRWRFQISRHHPPEEFDRIVRESASDLGRAFVDVVRLRNRYYDQWMEKLSFLTADYDFELEARRLVENALLLDIAAGMPLTGKDIIEELGFAPGPKVGSALTLARRLFDEAPRDRDALLAALKSELGTEGEA